MTEPDPRVWVCVPTYNESENVRPFVGRVLRAFEEAGIDGVVLVIDDASPDGTGRIAGELAAADARVRVLHRARKEGIGPAYRDGFRVALAGGADLVVEMDCDFSHDPAALPSLVAAAAGADLVLGSRYVRGGRIERWGPLRRAISRGGCLYAQAVLGVPVRDLTGGFKCFRRRVLETLPLDEVTSAGYGFQVEMTYRALIAGFRVVEVPITFTERSVGTSKMSGGIVAEAALKVPRLRRLRRGAPGAGRGLFAVPRLGEKTRDDWMQAVRFCVVGVSGYAVNLAVFAALFDLAGVHHLAAAVAAFAVAVTNNFLLNKYWTFRHHDVPASLQAARYLLVSLAALGLNLVILQALVVAQMPEIPAQALAVLAVTPVNFLLNRRWTFGARDGASPLAADAVESPGDVTTR